MEENHIRDFLQRFARNSHTEEEHLRFIRWMETAPINEIEAVAAEYQEIMEHRSRLPADAAETAPAIASRLDDTAETASASATRPADAVGTAPTIATRLDAQQQQRLLAAIGASIDGVDGQPQRSRTVSMRRIWLGAAAVLIVLLGTMAWLFYRGGPRQAAETASPLTAAADAWPGGDKAVLVLPNGTRVELGKSKGHAIVDNNGHVIADNPGELSYAGYGKTGDLVDRHTVRVPRKGQYHLVLSDGTQVWLNAESELTFPAAFGDSVRNVSVKGEAFFEVARDVTRPFVVTAGGVTTRVLGTAFNVNSYDDEPRTKVTLLQGAVSVGRGGKGTVLRPGQQAEIGRDGRLTVASGVNVEQVMAWKNGAFEFDNTDVHEVMRQLARWYDVKVGYAGDIDRHFNGIISRSVNASKVFAMLEKTRGVTFRIIGDSVIVSK